MLSKNDGGGPVLQKKGSLGEKHLRIYRIYPTSEFLQRHQNSTLALIKGVFLQSTFMIIAASSSHQSIS